MIGTVLATAATAAGALALPGAGLLGHRALRRSRNAGLMRIDSPRGIDEQGFVRIGGIDQWVSVRGEDRANPVIVEVHGGPGATNSPYGIRTRSWERHFTIVRWDMRGAGKTFGRGGAEGQGETTFERLYEDALEVTRHACERLGVERVLLLANSFGTTFGLRLARNHPELYSAYVGTDQNVHDGGRDTSGYRALLERLRAAGRSKDVKTVEAMGSDRHRWTAKQRAAYDKLCTASDPLTLDTLKKVVLGSMWLSPLHSLRDLRDFFKGQAFSERITPATAAFDDWADGTVFEVPFFLFQGDSDVITPTERARAYFDDVKAPVKEFALIENASHWAGFRHPDAFLHLLLTRVRPVITAPTHPTTA
ncbi:MULTISPECIES: alpha/beta fold hydrolase [unclassified Streptomyces]|uniref:alpha/beta fold hydrolase n=1 Tax=unclassified Streptomyces TaxID=2593676 RepID=UPI002250B190|nr:MULTISPECIES: alpha/beta hydrolase [unclassified Streptomyces]MCX4526412.1 alpha/beta hydrolase [Streptomyces sp. NBC_01551]MCX4543025.1 alpha/beta hydrolase [Streptomyces sp. NBC_01565]